jgi:NitT/TauT family transport system permease protein
VTEHDVTTAVPPPAEVPGAGYARRPPLASTLLTPKEQIPRTLALGLGLAAFVVVLAAWSIATYGGLVEPLFLPPPGTVAKALYDMFVHEGFADDVWASFRRIGLGFLIAAALAIPLGIAIGSFRAIQAFFEPIIGAVRYMPASAFIPLLIIWFGIGETEKMAVIWFGVFFPLTLMVADVSANIPKELVNIAELVAASTGIGHVILQSSRFLETEKIIAGILTIGALGLLSDAAFRLLYRTLFPYAERIAR